MEAITQSRGVIYWKKSVLIFNICVCTTRLDIQEFHVLPTPYIYVLYLDLRTKSDYFLIQH